MGVFVSKRAAIYCGANTATLALTVFFKKKKRRNEKETRFLVKRRRGRLEISLMP